MYHTSSDPASKDAAHHELSHLDMFVNHARVEGPGAYQVQFPTSTIVHDYVLVRALKCIYGEPKGYPYKYPVNRDCEVVASCQCGRVHGVVQCTYSTALARLVRMMYILGCTKE